MTEQFRNIEYRYISYYVQDTALVYVHIYCKFVTTRAKNNVH